MRKKKITASILAACMMTGVLFGCGGNKEADTAADTSAQSLQDSSVQESNNGFDFEDEIPDDIINTDSTVSINDVDTPAPEVILFDDDEKEKKNDDKQKKEDNAAAYTDTINGASYVFIYNPNMYDEYNAGSSKKNERNTGNVASQIIVGMQRADGLEEEQELKWISSNYFDDVINEVDYQPENRAGGIAPTYKVGDTHEFYTFVDDNLNVRGALKFKCIYEGTHCYIWDQDGTLSTADAEKLGKEFDNKIFDGMSKVIGTGRFMDDGGKMNVLMHPMADGLGGYFCGYDIFATGEISEAEVKQYGINLDHAIININSSMLKDYPEFIVATLAHEYQHQICLSETVEKNRKMNIRTWLNEAMSAYVEDYFYPGSKDNLGFYLYMQNSDNFRKGQSLYNFDIQFDEHIGAYGAVYLFEEYLTDNAGADVFKNVHDQWRKAKGDMPDEGQFIYESVSKDFRNKISQKYNYPASVAENFKSDTDLWMSKLTLDFYLSCLQMDMHGKEKDSHQLSIYSESAAQKIEGGGSMIVALNGNSFTIPKDADKGLIYIGLDNNFKPVTDLIVGTK